MTDRQREILDEIILKLLAGDVTAEDALQKDSETTEVVLVMFYFCIFKLQIQSD